MTPGLNIQPQLVQGKTYMFKLIENLLSLPLLFLVYGGLGISPKKPA